MSVKELPQALMIFEPVNQCLSVGVSKTGPAKIVNNAHPGDKSKPFQPSQPNKGCFGEVGSQTDCINPQRSRPEPSASGGQKCNSLLRRSGYEG
jgi:hypothetical protein